MFRTNIQPRARFGAISSAGAVALAFASVSGVLVGTAGTAHAYTTSGCKFSGVSTTVRVTSKYATATSNAFDAWYSTPTPVSFTPTSSTVAYGLLIQDQNNGNNGFDGFTTWTCSGGHYSSPPVAAYNTYYTDQSQYGGGGGRKQVMVHELGHALGLGHAGSATCAGQPIMYSASTRFFNCNHQDPQTDDINGVNYLY